jgi:hypothetical protein
MEVAEEASAVEVERVESSQPWTRPSGAACIVHTQELEDLPVDGRLALSSNSMAWHGMRKALLVVSIVIVARH